MDAELSPDQKAKIQAMAAQKTAELRDTLHRRHGKPPPRGQLRAFHQGYVCGMTAGALGLRELLESGEIQIIEGPSGS